MIILLVCSPSFLPLVLIKSIKNHKISTCSPSVFLSLYPGAALPPAIRGSSGTAKPGWQAGGRDNKCSSSLHFKIRTAATARHGACKLQTKALVSSSYCDGATMPFLTDAANIVTCADEPPHCVLHRMEERGASTWEFTCKAKVKVTHVFTS